MISVSSVPSGVSDSVRWLSPRVSTVRRRCMRSWSVPKAAIEPMKPLRMASQKMLGSVSTRRQKSGAPGAGPQLITLSRPAEAAVDPRGEEDHRRRAAHEEGAGLEDVGPDHGLHPA